MKKYIWVWLPILAWAGMIFIFSSQPYEKQSLRPLLNDVVNQELVSKLFFDFQITYAGREISVETVGVVGFLEFMIRKGAHFLVFFILGWLIYRAFFLIFKSRQVHSFVVSLILVIFYAASDEYHQMFTENRTPLIHDVLLDISGGLLGIYLGSLVYKHTIITKSKLSLPSK